MPKCWKVLRLLCGSAVYVAVCVTPAAAQVTPAAGYVPPDDTPSIRVGATIFADYTVQQNPEIKDVDGNDVTFNAFNIGRAYINVTGNISHVIAFRVTPDIVRETGTGSSLNGSLRPPDQVRLRAVQPGRLDGPWLVDAASACSRRPGSTSSTDVYRYRFQGTIFEDREGYPVVVGRRGDLPVCHSRGTTATSTAASTTGTTTTAPSRTIRRPSWCAARSVRCGSIPRPARPAADRVLRSRRVRQERRAAAARSSA